MSAATPIRVVVADDEKPARERLRRLLGRDTRVEIVACCAHGADTLRVIHEAVKSQQPVHILLLDIQMPEMNGFDVVSALAKESIGANRLPFVVFVTAYDEYALRAFESRAIDYLLKPFSDERFEAAMDRAIRFARAGDAEALMVQMCAMLTDPSQPPGQTRSIPPARPPLDRIVVKGAQRVRILPVDQIVWIEAEGVYVNLHTRDGAVYLHRELLGTLDQALDPRTFVRIHRSAIVNIDAVHELRQDEHGNSVAILRGGIEIRVGRHFRSRLQARLGQIP
jgi:two-component system LytT family response regulator